MLNLDIYYLHRGRYSFSILNTLLFSFLRCLDLPLQYYLLTSPIIPRLLASFSLNSLPSIYSPTLSTDVLPQARCYVLLFVTISTIKHNYWAWSILHTTMSPLNAIFLPLVNYFFDSINTVLYLYQYTSAAAYPEENVNLTMLAGGAIFICGTAIETFSEMQRRNFRRDPRSQGKPYSNGFFRWARHINYTGFTVYRTGMTVIAGGWVPGLTIAASHIGDFVFRAIPVLENYCSQTVSRVARPLLEIITQANRIQYGKHWEMYKERTKWKLFPGIY